MTRASMERMREKELVKEESMLERVDVPAYKALNIMSVMTAAAKTEQRTKHIAPWHLGRARALRSLVLHR